MAECYHAGAAGSAIQIRTKVKKKSAPRGALAGVNRAYQRNCGPKRTVRL